MNSKDAERVLAPRCTCGALVSQDDAALAVRTEPGRLGVPIEVVTCGACNETRKVQPK